MITYFAGRLADDLKHCADAISIPNRTGLALSVSYISVLALFILAGCAAGGVLTAAAAGYCAIGLGIGSLALKFVASDWEDRSYAICCAAVQAVAAISFGALAVSGVFTVTQLGFGILGMRLSAWFATSVILIYTLAQDFISPNSSPTHTGLSNEKPEIPTEQLLKEN